MKNPLDNFLTLRRIKELAAQSLPPVGTTFEYIYQKWVEADAIDYYREMLEVVDYGALKKIIPQDTYWDRSSYERATLVVAVAVKTLHIENYRVGVDSMRNYHFEDTPPQWVSDFMANGHPDIGFEWLRVAG